MTLPVPVYRLPDAARRAFGAGGVAGRCMGVLDAHTPTVLFGGPRVTHVLKFDVVILGGNALLASLAVNAARDSGLSVLWSGAWGLDGLPRGLAEDRAFRAAVAAMAGRGALENSLSRGYSSAVHLPRHPVSLALGSDRDLAILHATKSIGRLAPPDVLSAGLRTRLEGVCGRVDFPLRGNRRRAILADTVVLTSAMDGVAPSTVSRDGSGRSTLWHHPRVVGFGTARRDDLYVSDAVAAVFDDMATIISGEWLPAGQ